MIGAIGDDFNGHDLSEFTNSGATIFCPFIHNEKLGAVICSKSGVGIIHRSYPTGAVELNNKRYHWVQLQDFSNVQFCKLQREPVKNFEQCEKHFKACPVYKRKNQVRNNYAE
ncbi:MAG: hypothetical protein PHT13_00935 [Methanosarcina sp.]|nr:hypothetical protein [Methanosarcina sp.]